MARKNMASNKTKTTEHHRQEKASPSGRPWPRVGIDFCLGVMTMAALFVATPLGSWCVSPPKPGMVISVADNKAAQPPSPDEQIRLAQKRAARKRAIEKAAEKKAESKKDPMAELRRIEAINARNRRMMEQRGATRGYPTPLPTVPQPTVHQPHRPNNVHQPTVPSTGGHVRP